MTTDRIDALTHLPATEMSALAAGLRNALDAVETTCSVQPLLDELRAWVATGEVYADPALLARLTAPLDGLIEFIEVPRPE